MHKACYELFGDKEYFHTGLTDSKLLKTIKLPRKERDIAGLIQRCMDESQSVIGSSRVSAVQSSSHPEHSLAVGNISNHSRPSGVSIISPSIPPSKSLQQLRPRVGELNRDLRDHRVAIIYEARTTRAGFCWIFHGNKPV